VRIARVLPHGVELEHALTTTWPGGDQGAWVLGNVVEIRRGATSAWTAIGVGGAALGEIANEAFFQRRMELVRRLRVEVEDVRAVWIARAELRAAWTAACRAVTAFRRDVPRIDFAGYDLRDPAQRDELVRRTAALTEAADQLRGILRGVGHDVPDELLASDRVALPGQRFELALIDPSLLGEPVLWMDGDPARPARSETLAVAVGIAGRWVRWTEVPDLLRSAPDDRHYVVEIDGNSQVALRFGDGVTGAMLPPGAPVMARWVSGDESGDDLRAGAFGVAGTAPAVIAATTNPLPTQGGRPPESLDGIAARVASGLELPAIPITAADYRALLARRDGVAEARVALVHGAIDVVIRPAAGVAAGQLLDTTRSWLDAQRLAGATLRVRLPRALPIDIGVVVDVHPDVSAAELRHRVRRDVVAAFGDAAPDAALGRPRERAEIYRLVEGIAGVVWSQLVAFDVAGRTPPSVLEAIAPAADQIVRCAGIDEQPAGGRVTVWAARRFSLQLIAVYDRPDTRPSLSAIQQLVPQLLSGPASLAVQRGWTALTPALIDDALRGVFAGAGYTVSVRQLIADHRAVGAIALGDRELPILDTATVVDGGSRPA
jgi:hypothetical protein